MTKLLRKPIKGFHAYEILPDGGIWSLKNQQWLKANPDSDGYPQVKLYREDGSHTLRVHRLVALHWVTGRSKLPKKNRVVDHIDGNKSNYHWSNLRWCTQGENVKHGWERRQPVHEELRAWIQRAKEKQLAWERLGN